MRLENTGNIIKNIKISKKKVILYFSDSKLEISHFAYSQDFFYVGKSLTNKEMKTLEENTLLEEGMEYALKLLKKSIYSEQAIREKLYKKEISKQNIDKIIKFLKNNDLINDNAFIQDYLEYSEEQLYGKNKIIAILKEKGIPEERIKKIKFSDSKELKKCKSLLAVLEDKYDKYNYESKKKHIYDALIVKGYDKHIILEVINLIKDKNPEDELKKLNNDFKLIISKAKRKYENEEDINEFVVSSLLRKGYKYKDIKIGMEDYYEISSRL